MTVPIRFAGAATSGSENNIYRSVSVFHCEFVIHALITSRLAMCNSVSIRMSNFNKLCVQNSETYQAFKMQCYEKDFSHSTHNTRLQTFNILISEYQSAFFFFLMIHIFISLLSVLTFNLSHIKEL